MLRYDNGGRAILRPCGASSKPLTTELQGTLCFTFAVGQWRDESRHQRGARCRRTRKAAVRAETGACDWHTAGSDQGTKRGIDLRAER